VNEAHDAVRELLRDPVSANFREDVNVLGEVYPEQGVVCGSVNSKNGFGGYSGDEPYVYVRGEGATLGERDDDYSTVMKRCTDASRKKEQRLMTQLNEMNVQENH
jgi:hypothetical protein